MSSVALSARNILIFKMDKYVHARISRSKALIDSSLEPGAINRIRLCVCPPVLTPNGIYNLAAANQIFPDTKQRIPHPEISYKKDIRQQDFFIIFTGITNDEKHVFCFRD